MRPWLRAFCSIGAAAAVAAFLATLYVPWQIGTLLVVVPTAVGAISPGLLAKASRRETVRALSIVLTISVGIGGALFLLFAYSHRATFEVIAATIYPGEQPAQRGGTVALTTFWGSAFDYFASRKTVAVVNNTNQSENSTALVLLLPVAIATFGLAAAGRLRGRGALLPLLGCLAGSSIVLSWMLLPIPAAVGRFAFLTRVAPNRLFLPLGLASALSLALLVNFLLEREIRLPPVTVTVASLMFAAVQLWAAGNYVVDGVGISVRLATVFVGIVAVGVMLVLGGHHAFGLLLLAVFSLWQSSHINPIQRNLAPLVDSPLRAAVDRAKERFPADVGWVAFSTDNFVRGTLTAAGVNNLSSISVFPDTEQWEVLDPDNKFQAVWNRYAHVQFVAGAPGDPVSITLNATDSLTVTIDPCAEELKKLKVRIFVGQAENPPACSRPFASVDHGAGRLTLYERVAH